MGKIIGIDLGTTNSVCAVMKGGEPVVIPSAEGERLVPSVVAVNKNHERLVGRVARNQAIVNAAEHGLLHQALHGTQVQRRRGPADAVACALRRSARPRTAMCA